MRFLSVVAAAALLLTGAVHAQLSMTEIADQCADTAGFNTCWNNALNAAQMCYQHNCAGQGTCDNENDCTSSNPNCVGSCTCVAYEMMVQCALTSCWNMVGARCCATSLHGTRLASALLLTHFTGDFLPLPKSRHRSLHQLPRCPRC